MYQVVNLNTYNISSNLTLSILALSFMLSPKIASVYAQFPEGESSYRFATDPTACDPELGFLEVDVDAYGAVGSVISLSDRHHYNPRAIASIFRTRLRGE